jgi:glycosyltransferase involved in cell wall biosynthesis
MWILTSYLPGPNSGRAGELYFAFVGRLDPVPKGQDILFEVLSGPLWMSRPWQLTLYGEGRKRNGLERLAQRLGISDRVMFAGFMPPEEIWTGNHVLVMPSRFEGLPLAMVEAMLCGRPVVATDVAGHAEIIQYGVTGFLADAPTPASWRSPSSVSGCGEPRRRRSEWQPRSGYGNSSRPSPRGSFPEPQGDHSEASG